MMKFRPFLNTSMVNAYFLCSYFRLVLYHFPVIWINHKMPIYSSIFVFRSMKEYTNNSSSYETKKYTSFDPRLMILAGRAR